MLKLTRRDQQLQNIILRQTWHTRYRVVQNYQQKRQRDMKKHDSRVLDDETK